MILDNWEDLSPKFVKVMPVEYRRALEGDAACMIRSKAGRSPMGYRHMRILGVPAFATLGDGAPN
jgi:hypothetical protein